MLTWLEADGVTPLGSINMGVIGPGETYTGKHAGTAYQVVLKNAGANTVTDVEVSIAQVSAFPANQFALIATGATQPPSGWVDHETPLAIGTLAASASVNVWIDMSVPLTASRQLAQMVNLRAAGAEA